MKSKKIISAVLSAALLVTFAGCAREVPEETRPQQKPDTTVTSGTTGTPDKEETVYIISSADGTARQVIVSKWLKNTGKDGILNDGSSLQNIENVKGNEGFTSGSGNGLIWNTNGNDIYYQGTSSQKTPVELKITYTLDGKTITPAQLAGKSGRVAIRFDYTNHQTETVKIDGKDETIFVPFAAVTGVMLDTKVFSNVTVTNGLAENLGNLIVAGGIVFPGMQENLGIDKETLEIPACIEITADVKNFEMGPTMTLANASVFGKLDADDISIEDLKEQAEKLPDGMNQLIDGATQLNDGLNLLLDKSGALVDGMGSCLPTRVICRPAQLRSRPVQVS